MSNASDELMALYTEGSAEFKAFMIRAMKIYIEGPEEARLILDEVAANAERLSWPDIYKIIEAAEAVQKGA